MLTCQPFGEIGREVGLDQSIISIVFHRYISILLEFHGDKLFNNLNFFNGRLEIYNQKLKSKIQSGGDLVPTMVESVACITDGTRIQIYKPIGPDYVQREFYHGKDKIHCCAFQVTTGMDGIIMDVYGGFAGSRHDSYIFDSSLFNMRFADSQQGHPNIQYKSYMDKGYRNDTHAIAAYHILANNPQVHRNKNAVMSKQRIGVEWGIGKIYVICPIVKHLCTMKVQLSPVSKYFHTATLLTNIHTCLEGSQNATHFDSLARV